MLTIRKNFTRMVLLGLTCLAIEQGVAFAQPTPNVPGRNLPMIKSLMIREAPAEYAMWLLGETWGRHIVVNESAKKVNVRVFLRGIDCASALKAICHAHGLWYREDPESDVIYVQTLDEYIRGSSLNDKKFVSTVTVVYPRAEDIAASLQEVFKDMVAYTAPDEYSNDPSDDIDKAIERMQQLAEQSTIVESSTSSTRSSSRSSSGSSSRSRRNNDNDDGIQRVREYYDDLESLNKNNTQITAGLDGRPTPSLPGVVFLAVERASNTILLRSSDKEVLKQVEEMIATLDRPTSQVLLEVQVLELDTTDKEARKLDINFQGHGGDYTGSFADTALGAKSGVLQMLRKDLQLKLEFLDSNDKVRRLATPSLMVADLEASRIFVGSETTLLMSVEETVVTGSGNNPTTTAASNPETDRRDIGTTLVITPKIHGDGTVTVRIMQESASIGAEKDINYGTDEQGNQKTFTSTDVKKQTISSTVVAKSGATVSLGGLISHETVDSVSRVPILADLPYIGKYLFERTSKAEIEKELIVLIRPYVILTPDRAEKMSQHFLNSAVNDSLLLKEITERMGHKEALLKPEILEFIQQSTPIAPVTPESKKDPQ